VDEKLEDTQKLNRVADEAAEQAGKTERRYDQDHSIFTK
jgi:16S rRNA U1498 N3-methylase RsmE